ncbi:MAG: DUF998 domain-containing protein [Candidatus Hermodarchaeota archaeon]
MISEELTTELVISIDDSFPNSTSQFLKPFENLEILSINDGMHLNFEIKHKTKADKKNPILKLAQPKDAFEIVEIYNELYNGTYPYKEMEDIQEVQKMIKSPNCDWVVFKDIHNSTMGCFTFVLDFEDKMGYIRGLMLKKQYQGNVDVIKAVIGSYIGMYSKYKDKIFRWYCENRTAHAKSQFALSIGGIRPLAFYPNKDIFLGKVESDILHICYDERAITTMRSNNTPVVIPEVANCFLYSTQRYNLGACKFDNSELELNFRTIKQLRKTFSSNITRDKFGYETIRFTFDGSTSFFEFIYTPQIQNFEKTTYKVESLEELYVFVEKFMKCSKDLGIRYCEVFLSAYNPGHQKIFYLFNLEPRGYLPSWKYNKKSGVFEDYILFNYFEGEINPDIQLIEEGKRLLEILGIQYAISTKPKVKKTISLKKKKFQIWDKLNYVKSSIITGYALYLIFLLLSMGIAFSQGYNIITNTISQLGTFDMTPLPILFDISSVFGGFTTFLFIYFFCEKLDVSKQEPGKVVYLLCPLSRYSLIGGGIGIIMVGVCSIDRGPGIWHDLFSCIAFGGFTISLLGYGIIIIRSNLNIPKYFGFAAFLPFFTLIGFYIFISPFSEWLLLISIVITYIPLCFWLTLN